LQAAHFFANFALIVTLILQILHKLLDFADFANFAQIIKFCAKFCATKSWRLYWL